MLTTRRLGLLLALAVCVAPLLLWAADDKKPEPPKLEDFAGKVVPLADLVTKAGSRLDPDAGPVSLVLVTDDGKVYTLVKDGGARLFFKDPELLNRPMEVTGRLLPGSQILQATSVRSLVKGVPHEIYYWCDICSIRRGEKMATCECCGGPMERHEEPLNKK
jgi:hypothetical protein